MGEKQRQQVDNLAEYRQSGGQLVLDGALADSQAEGYFLVGKTMLAAQAVDALALRGKLADGVVDECL